MIEGYHWIKCDNCGKKIAAPGILSAISCSYCGKGIMRAIEETKKRMS